MPIDIKEVIDIYIVFTNTDLNEGKGGMIIKHHCKCEATARRLAKGKYIQGSDCPIEKIQVFKMIGTSKDSYFYGPISLILPTKEDINKQATIDLQNDINSRMLESGFTEEEIELIKLR